MFQKIFSGHPHTQSTNSKNNKVSISDAKIDIKKCIYQKFLLTSAPDFAYSTAVPFVKDSLVDYTTEVFCVINNNSLITKIKI
jgi:hypothetical protein